jgi:hypothetical protein
MTRRVVLWLWNVDYQPAAFVTDRWRLSIDILCSKQTKCLMCIIRTLKGRSSERRVRKQFGTEDPHEQQPAQNFILLRNGLPDMLVPQPVPYKKLKLLITGSLLNTYGPTLRIHTNDNYMGSSAVLRKSVMFTCCRYKANFAKQIWPALGRKLFFYFPKCTPHGKWLK